LLVLYRFQYRYRVFKPYVNQFHRKAFAPLNTIRALNGLPNLNNLKAQINNLSRSARVTFSAAYKLSDVRLSFSIVSKVGGVLRSLEVQGFANSQKLRTT
jgi:hypothetical protein